MVSIGCKKAVSVFLINGGILKSSPPHPQMLTVLFSKESVTYRRDALEVSHFSGTDPVPEDSVLESGGFWEGGATHLRGPKLPCPLVLVHGSSMIPDV